MAVRILQHPTIARHPNRQGESSFPRKFARPVPSGPTEAYSFARSESPGQVSSFVIHLHPKMAGWLVRECREREYSPSDLLELAIMQGLKRIFDKRHLSPGYDARKARTEVSVRFRFGLLTELLGKCRRILLAQSYEDLEAFFLYCLERERDQELEDENEGKIFANRLLF